MEKAGYKGDVWYGTDYKIGSGTWAWDGGTRNMQAIDQFQDQDIQELPLQRTGGIITISGNYLLAEDTGQKQIAIDFLAATEISNLRLYTDKTNAIYLTPSATGLNGGQSHCIVTNHSNVGNDKSGVGTWSCTLKVNGSMEQVGSTTAVAVETMGVVDIAATTVTMWGKLIHRGGEAGALDCYFEYGETNTFGTDSKADETVFTTPDVGEYDVEETLLTTATLYYYRAVCELADTSKVYGETKTFTTA